MSKGVLVQKESQSCALLILLLLCFGIIPKLVSWNSSWQASATNVAGVWTRAGNRNSRAEMYMSFAPPRDSGRRTLTSAPARPGAPLSADENLREPSPRRAADGPPSRVGWGRLGSLTLPVADEDDANAVLVVGRSVGPDPVPPSALVHAPVTPNGKAEKHFFFK